MTSVVDWDEPARILVVQLRRLGDVVLTTALVDDLRTVFPLVQIDFLVGPIASPLLDYHPGITTRLVYDRDHPIDMWRLIRSREYDWVIDVQSSPRTALLVWLSGAMVRVGWGLRGWGWVYTHRLPRGSRAVRYIVGERQRLLELLDITPTVRAPSLHLTPSECADGLRRIDELVSAHVQPVVGMLLSAGERSKEWRVDGFAELVMRLESTQHGVVIFQGPDDGAKVHQLQSLVPELNVAPQLDLRELLGALSACDVFVSADTGPAHMAVALGTPAVTIFGPSEPGWWSPGPPLSFPLRAEHVPCLGCRLNTCPIGHDCMTDLSADAVYTAVQHALAAKTWSAHHS